MEAVGWGGVGGGRGITVLSAFFISLFLVLRTRTRKSTHAHPPPSRSTNPLPPPINQRKASRSCRVLLHLPPSGKKTNQTRLAGDYSRYPSTVPIE